MQRNTGNPLISVAGPLAAILLGMALVPLRGFTSASNFTFVFLVLTILIAEYGGRQAAFATALCSALSLDFFLTQPYLQLAIKSVHDVVAFAGLALCGFLVATFSSQRGENTSDLDSAHRQLDLLHTAVSSLLDQSRAEANLRHLLDTVRACIPLAAAAVRDENNKTLAAFAADADPTNLPTEILSPHTLLPRGSDDEPAESVSFSNDGVRIPILFDAHPVGWLDLWGNGAPMSREMRRTLADTALLIGRILAMPGDTARLSPQHL